MRHNLFNSYQQFNSTATEQSGFYNLSALEAAGLGRISRLPVSIRIVLESVLRNCDGKKVTETHVRQLAAWQPNAPRVDEIPFVVARILLQDFTGVPLLCDLAAMRDASAAGAHLMIGPVFAPQVAAVKAAAAGTGLSVLALSNDAALAAPGVYIVGFAPAAQVVRVMEFALAHGAVRYAALIPNGAYGDIVAAAVNEVLARHHGVGARIGRYAPNSADFGPILQEIAVERGQLDALLIADGGTNLHRIAAALPNYQLKDPRIRLLGTGLWDEENLGRRAPQLIGGWYAAPEPKERNSFFSKYQAVYGASPPRLATLSYDATALAGVLARRGGAVDAGALTNPAGFTGVDGIFRFGYDGVAERGLAVNQLRSDGVRVLDPAPDAFVKEGVN